MNVLVTGAGGFIGGHLVRYLGERGCPVTAFSRRPYVGPPVENVEWLAGNLEDLTSEKLSRIAPDAVVHAAAQSPGVDTTVESLLLNNAVGTSRLARAAGALEASRVVYLSSISVYGEVTASVVDERTAVSNPSAYGMTKYLGELALAESLGSGKWVSIRLPGVVGRGAVNPWLARVAERLVNGEVVKIFNPDAPFNNVVHVADLCGFVETLLQKDKFDYSIVNAASGSPLTTYQTVSVLRAAMGSRSEVSTSESAGRSFTIDVDRALTLGFPERSVEQALGLYASDLLGGRLQ